MTDDPRVAQILAFVSDLVSEHESAKLIPSRRGDGLDAVIAELAKVAPLLHDASDCAERFEHLRKLAYRDPLTSLPNRALLWDRLEMALARARRHETQVGVLFIDLDGFKAINDRFGHRVGDSLLRRAAQAISDCLREYDTASRLGGDEFVVVVEDVTGDGDLAQVAATLEQAVESVRLEEANITVSASIGSALYPRNGRSADDLLHAADLDMYQRKRLKRGGPARDSGWSDTSAARLLIVDDERENIVLLRRQFSPAFEVRSAMDGKTAIEIARDWRPHAVLTDQRMDGITGIELLSQVRKELPQTVRILVTGYSDHGSLAKAVNEAGIHHYLEKPVLAAQVQEVKHAIERALTGGDHPPTPSSS